MTIMYKGAISRDQYQYIKVELRKLFKDKNYKYMAAEIGISSTAMGAVWDDSAGRDTIKKVMKFLEENKGVQPMTTWFEEAAVKMAQQRRAGVKFCQIAKDMKLSESHMRKVKGMVLAEHPELTEEWKGNPKMTSKSYQKFPSKEERDKRNELTWEARMLLANGVVA